METSALVVVGSTSVTPWGHDQLAKITEQARARGLRVVGIDRADRLAGIGATSGENDWYDELLPADPDLADECGRVLAGRTDIAAIITIREMSVEPVAVLAQAFGVRGNDPDAVHRIRNKDQCRQWLRERGFAQPSNALCSLRADAVAFVERTAPGPWVVKPSDGMASIGVSLVRSTAELDAAIDRVGRDHFLVETYVTGQEFSAEGVFIGEKPRVLALTRKLLNKGPGVVDGGFVETGHRQPCGLDAGASSAASQAVESALVAIGATHGIFHVEFWWTNEGVVLGELHVRGGGDFIHLLVEHTHPGVDMFGTLIDDLVGQSSDVTTRQAGAAGATFFTMPEGTIRALHGWDEIIAHPNVVASHLQVGVGDRVGAATGSYDRPGAIVVVGNTIDDVEQLTQQLADQLIVDVS